MSAMLRPMDLWRSAIVRRPALGVLREPVLPEPVLPEEVVWLPPMPPRAFRADPFGLWRDGRLYVFAETFDYFERRGCIEVLVYDRDLTLIEPPRTVLRRPFHLSYPVVFEAEGEIWMLPEAFASGTLTLYRARHFPDAWEPVCDLPLDGPAIDATPVRHEGRWWLFYSPSQPKSARRSHLHLAWAPRLTGPWTLHPANPVRIDPASARPGGTVLRDEAGGLLLPVQDCRATYGHAIRALRIDRLDEAGFAATPGPALRPTGWMAPHTDGLHTLSAAGDVTLIDVKHMDASLSGTLGRLAGIAVARVGLRVRGA
jgi:hypothetical protein